MLNEICSRQSSLEQGVQQLCKLNKKKFQGIVEALCEFEKQHDNPAKAMCPTWLAVTKGSIYASRTQVKLVDPASSHMLVLKIKPCMFKFIPLNGETANGSLNQL